MTSSNETASLQNGANATLPTRTKGAATGVELGPALKSEFLFADGWLNLNHGSFGTIPRIIRAKLREYQDISEARPDLFVHYDFPKMVDESRLAVAELVKAPADTVVFVHNATEGVNTVLRNMSWNSDGKDVVVSFSTVYGACAHAVEYLVDYYDGKVSHRQIRLPYPCETPEVLDRFRDMVKTVEGEGKRVRMCIFDVVSSRPGVVFPWEAMCKLCKELGVLSLVDGAQGIGMVHLDLPRADPDFFVSNCHKWLLVPRGCAVFYTPLRNQHLLPTPLATSHGYKPKNPVGSWVMPRDESKNHFVHNFQFVGTDDNSQYLCVKDAIVWRRDVLGGEERILNYLWDLNKKGCKLVADALGTKVLENEAGTLTNCAMGNVALPVWIDVKGQGAADGDAVVPEADTHGVEKWMYHKMVSEYHTRVPLHVNQGRFWVRLSAQVYLGLEDYEAGAHILMKLCKRVADGEWKSS